jgi:hypothetical protein
MQIIMNIIEFLRRFGQRFGPYVLLEILMPGGSLLALLLFIHRQRSATVEFRLRRSTIGQRDPHEAAKSSGAPPRQGVTR